MVLGYALLLVFFSLFTGRVNPLFFGPGFEDIFPRYAHAAELGQISCLIIGAICARIAPHASNRFLPVATAVLLTLGYLCTLRMAYLPQTDIALAQIAGFFFGMGQGACFLGWLSCFLVIGIEASARLMTIGTIVSAGIIFIVSLIKDRTALFIALAIIVIACCVLLALALARTGELGKRQSEIPSDVSSKNDLALNEADAQPNFGKIPGQVVSENPQLHQVDIRSLACLIAIAFVCGAQRVISLDSMIPLWSIELMFPLGYVVGAVIFKASLDHKGEGERVRSADGRRMFRIYPVLLLVMATCCILGIMQVEWIQIAVYAIDNIAFTVASMFMVITALALAYTKGSHALSVCGIVCASIYFSIQLGRLICDFVYGIFGSSAIAIMVISIIALYVVAIAAISSGVFMRGEASSRSASSSEVAHVSPEKPQAPAVAHIIHVSEERFRSNPVYREQYGLTNRELDVAVFVLEGYNATEMAAKMGISLNTVKTHLKKLYAKMGVHNRSELCELVVLIEKSG